MFPDCRKMSGTADLRSIRGKLRKRRRNRRRRRTIRKKTLMKWRRRR
jgi:hypothetical protein